MRIPRLSAYLRPNQPFFDHAIVWLTCGLSFWFTLDGCFRYWPVGNRVVQTLLVADWEGAKIHFFSTGLFLLLYGTSKQRVGGAMLMCLWVVLAAGSVAASMESFGQANAQTQAVRTVAANEALAKSLAESPTYVAVAANANSLARQINDTLNNAEKFDKLGLLTKAKDRRAEVAPLREAYGAAVASMMAMGTRLETVLAPPAGKSPIASWSGLTPEGLKHLADAVQSVMLELISVAAFCLVRRRRVEASTRAGVWPSVRLRMAHHLRRRGKAVALGWIARIRNDIEDRALANRSGESDDEGLRVPLASGAVEPSGEMASGAVEPSGAVAPGAVEPSGAVVPGAVEPSGAVVPGAVEPSGAVVPGAVEPSGAVASGAVEPSGAVVPGAVEPSGAVASGAVEPSGAVASGAVEVSGAMAAAKARALILRQQMTPTSRAIKRALNVGQAAALKILTDMHAEGLLARNGRGYELVA